MGRLDEFLGRKNVSPSPGGLLGRGDLVIGEVNDQLDLRPAPAPVSTGHPAYPIELFNLANAVREERETQGDGLKDRSFPGSVVTEDQELVGDLSGGGIIQFDREGLESLEVLESHTFNSHGITLLRCRLDPRLDLDPLA